MEKFVGRHEELKDLKRFLDKQTASLIVIKGRRRIGKSTLVEKFAQLNKVKLYTFVGLPPDEEITAQAQRDEFAAQLGLKSSNIQDWRDLFSILADKIKTEKAIVLFDEISWMARGDSTFRGKLKNVWDLKFKKNTQLMLVLCSSVSGWIEKNILENTGYVGRISYVLSLNELPLSDCNKFWNDAAGIVSSFEKLKIMNITGGVPRYLEEINPNISAEENIKNLCFKKGSLLFEEFDRIFNDTFVKRSNLYKNLLQKILVGKFEYEAIYKKLGVEKSGSISQYLGDLEKAGFVKRDYTWNLQEARKGKFSKYRINDNYVRFYLKYIEPNKEQIVNGAFENRSLTSLPGWETIMGLQFENLVLSNRKTIKALLRIKPEDVINDNPYFQTKTVRQEACQIDYLIQTRFNTLYVCEIKFSKDPVKPSVIQAVDKKIKNLKLKKHVSYRPVLIHVNGVSDDIMDSRYFAEIIDFSQLLEGE